MRKQVVALGIAGLVAACGHPRPGVRVAFTFTPDLTIGGADSGPASFTDVRSLAVDSAGRIYVLEGRAQQVRGFDSTGAFVRTMGRAGEGPGEFSGVAGMVLDVHGRLWVLDPRAQRVTSLDPASGAAATFPLRMFSYPYFWDGSVDPLGRVYDFQPRSMTGDSGQILRRTDLTRGTVDSLRWPECGQGKLVMFKFQRGFMGVRYAAAPYQWMDRYGHAWCASTGQVRLSEYVPGDSMPIHVFQAVVQPAAVTGAERDSILDGARKFETQAGTGDIDPSLIPRTKAVFWGVDVDDRGRAWVRAFGAAGPRLLTFDSAGRLLADSPWTFGDNAIHHLVVANGHLYTVLRDSLDIPRVVRFRINEPATVPAQ
jgi:hypothetical protein